MSKSRPAVEDQGKDAESILLGLGPQACHRAVRAYANSIGLSASSFGLTFQERSAKGLGKEIQDVFGTDAQVPQCTWHKRENVEATSGRMDQLRCAIQEKRPRAALRAAEPHQLTGTLAWVPMLRACGHGSGTGYYG